ncbi:Limonene 1,2-monooxygenase [Mycobacterium marinum]|uniref:LLM class flavin-dependent oxidoreductase n=1 Tax=Mycobacterium marinum TaxID=1781 RepID=UPI000E3D3F4F|nr:LLM class flavin-dependent oxidoreductase [Mycobacterium marinum]RFZ02987.1 Limonene 1,2-monooxygenase [Mycobacterium marinum]
MRISVEFHLSFEYSALQQLRQAADHFGFEGIWDYDHFCGPAELAEPTFEGWTTLAAMAAVTQRTRIVPLVTGVIYGHPAILAKRAVTVDHICVGQLNFGIGAGWHEAEHYGPGVPAATIARPTRTVRRPRLTSMAVGRG